MRASSGYTTAELLALRATPTSPRASASSAAAEPPQSPPFRAVSEQPTDDYQSYHRAVLANHTSTFAFAHYSADAPSALVVASSSSADSVERAHRGCPASLFRRGARLQRWLRYGRNVACFNLYPATKRDLQVNDLLWRVAQSGEYDPHVGNFLLENNVLSLAMPAKFFEFLSGISKHDLKTCMLQVLALIAEDEDAEGLALMKSELDPSVWDELAVYISRQRDSVARIDTTTERGLKLMRDVEMLLRLCYLSPWKIDVYASFVTPQDMTLVISEAEHVAHGGLRKEVGKIDVADRKLVRSSARRPVSSQPQAGGPPPRCRATTKTAVFWKLFLDWRRHRKVLVQGLGLHPAQVTTVMMHAIARGNQALAWERAEVVMACACRSGNLLSNLPKEVVFNLIAPHVLLAGSKL